MVIRLAHGHGIVLSADTGPFHQAHVRPASGEEATAWFAEQRPARAALEIGTMLLAPDVPATLDAGGFNRHTFMCGQSGSGKTYSLGLVLEQLLLHTDLRMVILDPNSDYVRLGDAKGDPTGQPEAAYGAAASGVQVWGRETEHPLRLMLPISTTPRRPRCSAWTRSPTARSMQHCRCSSAAVGRAAPVLGGLDDLLNGGAARGARPGPAGEQPGRARLVRLEPGTGAFGHRCRAGRPTSAASWSIWGRSDTPQEQRAHRAGHVVRRCGATGTAVNPCLVVIDEAHNVCPREPADPMTRLAADTAALIAAEGRKFGLYLLVSTQRPQKVNEEVLTQCDNLLLMRMNSEADLGYLREVFSFVPGGMVYRATSFRQGESLAGGKFFPHAGFVRFGARQSHEGGADIPTDWAGLR